MVRDLQNFFGQQFYRYCWPFWLGLDSLQSVKHDHSAWIERTCGACLSANSWDRGIWVFVITFAFDTIHHSSKKDFSCQEQGHYHRPQTGKLIHPYCTFAALRAQYSSSTHGSRVTIGLPVTSVKSKMRMDELRSYYWQTSVSRRSVCPHGPLSALMS